MDDHGRRDVRSNTGLSAIAIQAAVMVLPWQATVPMTTQGDATGHHVWLLGPVLDADADGVDDYVLQAQRRQGADWVVNISVRSGRTNEEISAWHEGGSIRETPPVYRLPGQFGAVAGVLLIRQSRVLSAHKLSNGEPLWSRPDRVQWKGLLSHVDGDLSAVLAVPVKGTLQYTDELVSVVDARPLKGPDLMEWGRSIPVGDVNGDGRIDAARRCLSVPGIALVSGESGRFEWWTKTDRKFNQILATAVRDIDGDNRRDLLVLGFVDGKQSPVLTVLLGSDWIQVSDAQPCPNVVSYDELPEPAASRIAMVGDIDADGWCDAACVWPASQVESQVDDATGAYIVSLRSIRAGTEIWRHHRGWVMSLVALPDRDGDGIMELVVVNDGAHLTTLSGRSGEVLEKRAIFDR